MSVRQSLLAILAQGSCYGYQLRGEFARRTGDARTLNVGQVYNTLDRLERDGLVARGASDERGHVFYEVTDAGRDEARTWFDTPLPPGGDDLPAKLALASTLPGIDARAVVRRQRAASAAALRELRVRAAERSATGSAAAGLAARIVVSALLRRTQAELDWLDDVDAQLAGAPTTGLEIEARTPRRGRPPKNAAREALRG
ncbi:PadR family transcriptional regulator [Microbacterium sp. LRZ72]|uniref:PadR family transcriptional regulator n=1 Tax=Microbacterium sp. LRZ72 TaxID=2942481 RepID=UPI0029AD49E2|nr:PadR family transcriptional regulator [Microbacterium sp. LRZ72]MDX2377059.1 PadR family transcriptional regulator [Microbacterium sp. LRZ72]